VPARVSADVSLCLYRVAQEALHNVVRHSGATQASVRIARESDALTLQIADQGVGFSLVDVDRAGLGLISMQERISFLGGDVAIHSSPGGGTRIRVRVPLSVGAPSEAAGSA
jgi:signal transduction histidine kinase